MKLEDKKKEERNSENERLQELTKTKSNNFGKKNTKKRQTCIKCVSNNPIY